MTKTPSDRNLLTGIIALRADFVSRDQLIEAMNAWWQDQAKSLGEILVQQRVLTEKRRLLLEALVLEHMESHHHDPRQGRSAGDLAEDTLSEVSSGFLPDLQEYLAASATAGSVSAAGEKHAATPPDASGTVDQGRRGTGLGCRLPRPHLWIWAVAWIVFVVAMISLAVLLLVTSR